MRSLKEETGRNQPKGLRRGFQLVGRRSRERGSLKPWLEKVQKDIGREG